MPVQRPKPASRRPKAKIAFAALGVTAALGAGEMLAARSIDARVDGLVEGQGSPAFCDAGMAGFMRDHFTSAQLRLVSGAFLTAVEGDIRGRRRAIDAAVQASFRTGVRVDFILSKMMLESSLGVDVAAATSTARGNLQSLEETWIELIDMHVPGDRHYAARYGRYADAIKGRLDENGLFVYDALPAPLRAEILALRETDPYFEAYIFAKHWAKKDPSLVQGQRASFSALWRVTGEGAASMFGTLQTSMPIGVRYMVDSDFAKQADSYRAHFLGARGSKRLSDTGLWAWWFGTAADLFPAQAAANQNIFYEPDMTPRSPRGVFNKLNDRVRGSMAQLWAMASSRQNLAGVCAAFRQRFPSVK